MAPTNESIRLWCRRHHMLSPKLSLIDLDSIPTTDPNWQELSMKLAFSSQKFPSPSFQVADIDPDLISDDVISQLKQHNTFLRKFFQSYATPRLFDSPVIAPDRADAVTISSFLECISDLKLNGITPGVVALNFRRSKTALRSDDSSSALCFPEFIEALLRCCSECSLDLIDGINCSQETPPTTTDTTTTPTRPLSPRKRNSADLNKWPHRSSTVLDQLSSELDQLQRGLDQGNLDDSLYLNLLEQLCSSPSQEDIFIQQKLLPTLRNCLIYFLQDRPRHKHHLETLLPHLVRIVNEQSICLDSSILPNNTEDAISFTKLVLRVMKNQVTAVSFLVSITQDGQHEMTKPVLDTILNLHQDVRQRCIVPLLVEELDRSQRIKEELSLCLGVLSTTHNVESTSSLDILLDLLRFGDVDPQVCAFSIRCLGYVGTLALMDIAKFPDSSPVFSANARSYACWGLSLAPKDLLGKIQVEIRTRTTPVSKLHASSIVYVEGGESAPDINSWLNQLDDAARRTLFLSLDVRHVVARIKDVNLTWSLREELRGQEVISFSEVCDTLVASLNKDPEPIVREAAAKAMGASWSRCVSTPLFLQQSIIQTLCKHASDVEDSNVRYQSIMSLAQSAVRFEDLLRDASLSNYYSSLRFVKQITSCATKLLSDPIWKVRLGAVTTLGHFGIFATDKAGHVADAMKSGAVMHKLAGEALARLGEHGTGFLVEILDNKSLHAQTRISACHGLAFVPPQKEVVNVLYANTQDLLAGVRANAYITLSILAQHCKAHNVNFPNLSVRVFHPKLYNALNDIALEKVGYCAAEILAKDQPEGELLLVEALQKSGQQRMKRAAIHGLGIIGAKSTRSLLLAMRDKDPLVSNDARVVVMDKIAANEILLYLKTQPEHVKQGILQSIRRTPQVSSKFAPYL